MNKNKTIFTVLLATIILFSLSTTTFAQTWVKVDTDIRDLLPPNDHVNEESALYLYTDKEIRNALSTYNESSAEEIELTRKSLTEAKNDASNHIEKEVPSLVLDSNLRQIDSNIKLFEKSFVSKNDETFHEKIQIVKEKHQLGKTEQLKPNPSKQSTTDSIISSPPKSYKKDVPVSNQALKSDKNIAPTPVTSVTPKKMIKEKDSNLNKLKNKNIKKK